MGRAEFEERTYLIDAGARKKFIICILYTTDEFENLSAVAQSSNLTSNEIAIIACCLK